MSEEVKTPETAVTPARTVPYERFTEINDLYRQVKEQLDALAPELADAKEAKAALASERLLREHEVALLELAPEHKILRDAAARRRLRKEYAEAMAEQPADKRTTIAEFIKTLGEDPVWGTHFRPAPEPVVEEVQEPVRKPAPKTDPNGGAKATPVTGHRWTLERVANATQAEVSANWRQIQEDLYRQGKATKPKWLKD